MRVTALTTISIDGRITPPGGEGTPFSSRETGANLAVRLTEADVLVLGRRTWGHEGERVLAWASCPNVTRTIVMTRDPGAHADPALPEVIEFSDLAAEAMLDDLAARGHREVLVLGGGQVYAAFAATGRVDEWTVVVEPVLLGGGTPVFSDVAELALSLVEHRLLNDDTVLLRYGRAED